MRHLQLDIPSAVPVGDDREAHGIENETTALP